MKKTTLLTATLLLLTAILTPIWASTVIAVAKKASKDGSVIIPNTDTGPDSRIRLMSRQTHKEREQAPVY